MSRIVKPRQELVHGCNPLSFKAAHRSALGCNISKRQDWLPTASFVECSANASAENPVVDTLQPKIVTLLIGDIGGTNCRFELVEADANTRERVPGKTFAKTFSTQDFDAFDCALRAFMDLAGEQGSMVSSCCLAVAGPVVGNRCAMTNLNWVVDGESIAQEFGFKTAVLNDFVAVGYAIPTLKSEDLETINDAERDETGPIAVLGPGTGLGEVQLMWDSGLEDYVAWASEGAHAGFAPRGELQTRLLQFSDAELLMPTEKPKDITARGLSGECPLCSDVIDIFLEILGAEAAAMGLRSMATGGVFIAGGIPPKLLERIRQGGLLEAYLNRASRFSQVTQQFPLYVLKEEAGLAGVFNFAINVAKRLPSTNK